MSNDEECIRQLTATLRSAIDHERKDQRHDSAAIDAAVGAIFDESRAVRAQDTESRRRPAV